MENFPPPLPIQSHGVGPSRIPMRNFLSRAALACGAITLGVNTSGARPTEAEGAKGGAASAAAAKVEPFVEIKMVPVGSTEQPVTLQARMKIFDPPLLLERGDPIHKNDERPPWLPSYRFQCHYADYSYSDLHRFFTEEFLVKNGLTPEKFAALKKNYPEGGPSLRLASVLWAVEAKVKDKEYWTVALYEGSHLRRLPTDLKELPRGIAIWRFINTAEGWKGILDYDMWFLNFPMQSAEALKQAFKVGEVKVNMR